MDQPIVEHEEIKTEEATIQIEFKNINPENIQKILEFIQNNFVPSTNTSSSKFSIFKDYILDSVPKDSVNYDVTHYERLIDHRLPLKGEVLIGSIKKCFNCGRPDHVVKECPNKKDQEEIKRNVNLFHEIYQKDSKRYYQVIDEKIQSEKEEKKEKEYEKKDHPYKLNDHPYKLDYDYQNNYHENRSYYQDRNYQDDRYKDYNHYSRDDRYDNRDRNYHEYDRRSYQESDRNRYNYPNQDYDRYHQNYKRDYQEKSKKYSHPYQVEDRDIRDYNGYQRKSNNYYPK